MPQHGRAAKIETNLTSHNIFFYINFYGTLDALAAVGSSS